MTTVQPMPVRKLCDACDEFAVSLVREDLTGKGIESHIAVHYMCGSHQRERFPGAR